MTLMFTYGINTNAEHMSRLCPTARKLGTAVLPNYSLVFKRHCDVETHQGAQCAGVLWEVDQEALDTLDTFEGYPTYYERKYVEVWFGTERVTALVYYMTPGHEYRLPSDGYFQDVRAGYINNGIDTTQLIYAVANTRHILSDRANKVLTNQ